ncbi:hypothetical protein CGRA01v4_07966 [Colletotrichum graminicola]|nr:hypothetical protein CGRA01v4_07966 [Colletotrichum graminicola]
MRVYVSSRRLGSVLRLTLCHGTTEAPTRAHETCVSVYILEQLQPSADIGFFPDLTASVAWLWLWKAVLVLISVIKIVLSIAALFGPERKLIKLVLCPNFALSNNPRLNSRSYCQLPDRVMIWAANSLVFYREGTRFLSGDHRYHPFVCDSVAIGAPTGIRILGTHFPAAPQQNVRVQMPEGKCNIW